MKLNPKDFKTTFYDGNHIIRFGVDPETNQAIQHFVRMINGEVWIEKYVLDEELHLVGRKKVYDFNKVTKL